MEKRTERLIPKSAVFRYDFDADKKEKELLTGAYLDIQQSVLIHALVEVFDSKRMNDGKEERNFSGNLELVIVFAEIRFFIIITVKTI